MDPLDDGLIPLFVERNVEVSTLSNEVPGPSRWAG
jgi:hypothetical protein